MYTKPPNTCPRCRSTALFEGNDPAQLVDCPVCNHCPVCNLGLYRCVAERRSVLFDSQIVDEMRYGLEEGVGEKFGPLSAWVFEGIHYDSLNAVGFHPCIWSKFSRFGLPMPYFTI